MSAFSDLLSPFAEELRQAGGRGAHFHKVGASALGHIEGVDIPDPLIQVLMDAGAWEDAKYTEYMPVLPWHDTSAAVMNAQMAFTEMAADMPKAEWWDSIPLPFDHTVFEFKAFGFRQAFFFDGPRRLIIAVIEAREGDWIAYGGATAEMGQIEPSESASVFQDMNSFRANKPTTALLTEWVDRVANLLFGVCVAMDIGIAELQREEISPKLNSARARRGKQPLRDYHIVKLHRRYESASDGRAGDEAVRRAVRLHAVRGHWRQLPEHKTWVKWHWRGNPSLGVVQKHYQA